MPLLRLLPWLLPLLASACATPPAPTPQATVFVMRHLHTPAGERDPDLTWEGRRQAELLASWFREERPAVVYVSHFRRTRQTAAPLAARLGLTPIVYDPADTPALVAQVRGQRRPVLVVGHSNTVGDIIEQLGGSRPPPLAHEDFGDIWRIDADGTTTRMQISVSVAE